MSTSVSFIHIETSADVGQRLDNYLHRELKGVPRSHVYKILRSGEVRVNGKRARAGYRIQLGDQLRIPPIRTRKEVPTTVSAHTEDVLRRAVLHEDEDIIVLNKPAGFAVHGGSSVSAGVVEAMRVVFANPRLELVHRLDRGTSGCLLLAKRPQTLRQLQAAFRSRDIKKVYHLVVWGRWPRRLSRVDLRLRRYETAWGERRVRVASDGQSASTDFRVLEHQDRASRLEAVLHTGRTHQIRVHTSASGHPIVGDDKYGGVPQQSSLNRLCLHAQRLQIPDPSRPGSVLKFNAPVPDEIDRIWSEITA